MKKSMPFLSLLFFCILLVVSNMVHAQVVPESYRRQKQQEMTRFGDSIYDEFVRYLEQLWTEYQLFEGEHSPRSIKPAQQPLLHDKDSDDTLKIDLLLHHGEISTIQDVKHNAIQLKKKGEFQVKSRDFLVPFYGRNITVRIPNKVNTLRLSGTHERQVARFWKQLLDEHADQCAVSLDQHRRNFYLGDWGLFDLIRHVSATVYPDLPDEQAVLTVFLLDALHYDARIGRMDSRLVMLVNTGSRLYEVPYVTLDSIRYYAFGNLSRKRRIHTYDRQMAAADRAVDLHLPYSPQLGGGLSSRAFCYNYSGSNMVFRVNQSLIDFYSLFPQTELSVYASAALEESIATALQQELHPLVEGLGTEQALNLLLDFIQHGFKYQTDVKQFGREKTFFCEENFFYPANDCEDRAILFARVVRMLFNYDVVLLEFDDHVATAVHIPGRKIRGHHLDLQGHRFMVCDPTYIGATVGDLGRKYRNKTPKIIAL